MMHRSRQPVAAPDRGLVEALLRSDALPGAAATRELVETHISWVILAGEFAYKIKKPLRLPFLDFSTLALRRHYCEEELRLNKPSAPGIYLDVVAISMRDGVPRLDGRDPVEYALRMRRFDQSLRLDVQLEAGRLSIRDMRELGEVIAERHGEAARIDARRREHQVATTTRLIRDNFSALDGFVDGALLADLRTWTERDLACRDDLFRQRFDEGFVRDCHGDLHLGNIVRLDSGMAPFDCIEFDPDLRAIDVMCDVGFLAMDLVARGRRDLAAHFLNRYLESTGDYRGVALLDTYFVYRCLVRAKVEVISSQECTAGDERQAHLGEANRYAQIALRQTCKPAPVLVLMHGLSGSGKTWISARLMAALPAVRIRSDLERKRLHGLRERESSGSDIDAGIYSDDATERVYARLNELAAALLRERHSVVLDAAFLDRARRVDAVRAAAGAGAPAVILAVDAPVEVLRRRVSARAAAGSDASEAGLAVLEHQLAQRATLGSNEGAGVVVRDTSCDIDFAELAAELRDASCLAATE